MISEGKNPNAIFASDYVKTPKSKGQSSHQQNPKITKIVAAKKEKRYITFF